MSIENLLPENWIQQKPPARETRDDGDAAFPCPAGYEHSNYLQGMSLRDFFAAAALTGIKSNPTLLNICSQVDGLTQHQAVAKMAYIDADAMIAERNK